MHDPLLAYRDRFPILEKKIYLASHTLGPAPAATREALLEFYDAWNEQGILAWDAPWWDAVTGFSELIEDILHAPRGSVVPMQNVTRAFAAIFSCFEFEGAERNRVVTTGLEFTTTRPFMLQQRRLGAQVEFVGSDDGISIPTERICEAIDERTRLVVVSHTFFRSAALADLKTIAKAAHEKGAYLVGDGYQTAGCVPVRVRDLDVDFFVGGSHKWLCGGPGAGYLYVKKSLIPTLEPRFRGWFGLKDPFAFAQGDAGLELNEGVYRFLAGTPNVPACYSAREGLKIIREIGDEAIRAKSLRMTRWCMEQADARGLTVRTPRADDQRSGMVCINFDGAKEACEALCASGVVCDFRPDCGVRMSPHFFTTMDELGVFFERLDRIRSGAVTA